ncbi:MAG TPA: sulfite exporter TauE/SafE family protein [Terriglobales bacterium]|nr:sulfite exporter TauE/SafE family protein [Terriglobales bacterium]
MDIVTTKILIGLLVGFLIGLTGLGGGVLLLPILIFGLGIPAIIAVGSDAAFNFLTKIPSSIVHLAKGTVRKRVVAALAVGSVPGSILGVRLLQHLRVVYGAGVNEFIKSAVGILLIVVSTMLVLQRKIERGVVGRPPTAKSFTGMAFIGLVAGFLVGMTSVGSGSIIMMLLLLLYSYQPKVMVGTDIVHAMVLTGVTSLLHFRLGNVDPKLVFCLLIGSVPGGIFGSYLSTRVPVLWLRRILCTILFATGVRMLIATPVH